MCGVMPFDRATVDTAKRLTVALPEHILHSMMVAVLNIWLNSSENAVIRF